MRTLEDTRPRPGLSVPVVTVLDDGGELLEADQRAVVRFVVQDGYGADIVFAAGTTGEWDRLGNATRQRVVQVCAEEMAKANAELAYPDGDRRRVELWAGITARSAGETLENLEHAIAHRADGAVVAPLSIPGIDPVRFLMRDVADLLDRRTRRIPVYLYDNADIAVDPRARHIRTRQVKALSRLDFVRGIKVSAPRRVLGNYTKAAAGFRERGEFGIYVGSAMQIFDIFRPRPGWRGAVAERWNRWRLRGALPIGVVSGPANVFPREWARAWQVCRAGDAGRMDEVRGVLEGFQHEMQAVAGPATLACLKRGLLRLGVVTSEAVAPGTPRLSPSAAARFDALFERARARAESRIGEPWVSRASCDSLPPALGGDPR